MFAGVFASSPEQAFTDCGADDVHKSVVYIFQVQALSFQHVLGFC